jgi:hypothetical protein
MADRLYRLDQHVLHVCRPEADGTPLTLYITDPGTKPE